MPTIKALLESNRAWAQAVSAENPAFFQQLSAQQAPGYLWIGCADSRVPATQLTGLMPGEMFVHRNIANLVNHTDLNCLAVIQYAVEVLQVEHIIVCGHYGCGGVETVLRGKSLGLIDNWLLHIHDILNRHRALITAAGGFNAQLSRLCEINVIEQAANLAQTTIVRQAWQRRQKVTINGLIYGLQDGLLQDLGLRIDSSENLSKQYQQALNKMKAGDEERGLQA
ncbi:MAG: carbonate dehydratase [Anaerolineales bacterium]|jgi:carbonic anhydrase|nr:carbonate dehydratase [Anaerolineales bacterium]